MTAATKPETAEPYADRIVGENPEGASPDTLRALLIAAYEAGYEQAASDLNEAI